jgi:protease-4
MPDTYDPHLPPPEGRPPLTVYPVVQAPPRPSMFARFGRWLLRTALLCSIGLNFFLFFLVSLHYADGSSLHLYERYHSGSTEAHDKVAVLKMEGTIFEGLMGYIHKQIEHAAGDDHVKAVVLRINSPGGTITASDELYRRLIDLREGNTPGHHSFKKPIIVSMASLAASGGYYVAMPAERILAERTTITGSIGVYAAFPNISGLAKKYGIDMDIIKAGGLKDSGSMFKEMKPQQRQLWQDMVDHAYHQFLAVVEEGRPKLKGKLTDVVSERLIPADEDDGDHAKKPKEVKYVRRRADGGIFTADKALQYGLIDQIGTLEDAVKAASQSAGLGDNYKAVVYDKPPSLFSAFLQTEARQSAAVDPSRLAAAAAPRLWYLAPHSELAAILSALGRE